MKSSNQTLHEGTFYVRGENEKLIKVKSVLVVEPSFYELRDTVLNMGGKLLLHVNEVRPSEDDPDSYEVIVVVCLPIIEPIITFKVETFPPMSGRESPLLYVHTVVNFNRIQVRKVKDVSVSINLTRSLEENTYHIYVIPSAMLLFPETYDEIIEATKTIVRSVEEELGVEVSSPSTTHSTLHLTFSLGGELKRLYRDLYTNTVTYFVYRVRRDKFIKTLNVNFLVLHMSMVSVLTTLKTFLPLDFLVEPQNYKLELSSGVERFLQTHFPGLKVTEILR